MKKLILVLGFLILISVFSGCIDILEVVEDEDHPFVAEKENTYIVGDTLNGLTFRVKDYNVDTTNGFFAKFYLYEPQGTMSQFSDSFSPPVEDECFVDAYSVVFYTPGMWDVVYYTYEGMDDTGTPFMNGEFELIVEEPGNSQATFELIDWSCPDNVTNGESIVVEFTLKNTGRADGRVSAVLFNDETSYDENLMVYQQGYIWYKTPDDGVLVKPAMNISQKFIIPIIENDLQVTLEWSDGYEDGSGGTQTQFVECIGGSNVPKLTGELPIGLYIGVALIAIVVVIVLILKRPLWR